MDMEIAQYLDKNDIRPADFARAIGMSPALLYQCSHDLRPVPVKYCLAIEIETGKKISRKDLRPDDWQKIWPELAIKSTTEKVRDGGVRSAKRENVTT